MESIVAIKSGDYSRIECERSRFIIQFDALRSFSGDFRAEWGGANRDFSLVQGRIIYAGGNCHYTSRRHNGRILLNGSLMAEKVLENYRATIRRFFIGLATDPSFNMGDMLVSTESLNGFSTLNIGLVDESRRADAEVYYTQIPIELIQNPTNVDEINPDPDTIYFLCPLIGPHLFLVGLQWRGSNLIIDMSHYAGQ